MVMNVKCGDVVTFQNVLSSFLLALRVTQQCALHKGLPDRRHSGGKHEEQGRDTKVRYRLAGLQLVVVRPDLIFVASKKNTIVIPARSIAIKDSQNIGTSRYKDPK